jgi:hypothetical protein
VQDGIQGELRLMLELLGLDAFEPRAHAIALGLHTVGTMAVLLGAELHLDRVGAGELGRTFYCGGLSLLGAGRGLWLGPRRLSH